MAMQQKTNPQKTKSNYCVYKHTSPSGKVYIGITSQSTERRWTNGTGYKRHALFARAIKKYGWQAFTHEILFTGLTRKEAEAKERELIAAHRSNDTRYGYNCTAGGESNDGDSNPMFGRHHTEAAKQLMRERKAGKRQTEDHIQKRVAKVKGQKRTAEQIERAAKSKMKRVVCLDTGIVYESLKAAHEQTGASYGKISECCKGKRKTTAGLRWAYCNNKTQFEE